MASTEQVRPCTPLPKSIADAPGDVIRLTLSHLATPNTRYASVVCKSFRSPALSLMTSLASVVPRDQPDRQLQILTSVTNLSLEVRDLTTAAPWNTPRCTNWLRSLKLVGRPARSAQNTCGAEEESDTVPHSADLESLTAAVAASTRLTRLALRDCSGLVSGLLPSCPQLVDLEVVESLSITETWPRGRFNAPCYLCRGVLQQVSTLRTLRLQDDSYSAWAALLPELAHLPNLRSLGTVRVEEREAAHALFLLTRLTQLSVIWAGYFTSNFHMSRLSGLSDLEFVYGNRFTEALPGLLELTQLQRITLLDRAAASKPRGL